MPAKRPASEKLEPSRATPETIIEIAGQAQVGPIDEKTALLIKLCESKTRADSDKEIALLKEKHRGLREKHIATLRELQHGFIALGFDDFLKILIGILGGFLVREIS